MSKQHSVTKPNRRNKSGKRKDFTRGTMLALRSPENTARATQQAQAIALARHAHRNLREGDPKTTSVVRFIGAWFISMAVLFLVAFVMSQT